jgi:hypothetical protein
MNTTVLAAEEPRIGRYAPAELRAMQGRRGRKPPEFYQLFPEQRKEPVAVVASTEPKLVVKVASKQLRKADLLAERIRAAPAAVRQIIVAMLDYAESAPGVSIPEAAMVSDAGVAGAMASVPQVDVGVVVPEALAQVDPIYADPDAEISSTDLGEILDSDVEPEMVHVG